MVKHVFSAAFAAAALVGTAYAGAKGTRASPCPKDTPCCSLYGDCGVGAFCLGGCDPTMSNSLNSCVPGPTCQSKEYDLKDLSNVQSIDKYLGDASKVDWQSQGDPQIYNGDSTLLTMAQGTVGTLLASTHYIWYGKVCATLTTAQGQGVVTAFILMSDVKDEIDFEWIGVDTDRVQSNYYSQGNTVYTNSANLTVSGGSTASTMHEYCFDWNPDTLTWLVDGNSMRTLKRSDTWNSTSGRFDYPQTPARAMLSLWPAGLASNGKGTVDWAGGLIDWNSKYMQNGYYFARFSKVTVQCYDPPAGAQVKGSKVYQYMDKAATNATVAITDNMVILGSLLGTGDNPGTAPKSGSPQPTMSVDSVPGGIQGGGARTEQTATAAAGGPQASGTGSAGGSSGFSQGNGQGTGKGNAGSMVQPGLGRVAGGVLTVAVAVLGLFAL